MIIALAASGKREEVDRTTVHFFRDMDELNEWRAKHTTSPDDKYWAGVAVVKAGQAVECTKGTFFGGGSW